MTLQLLGIAILGGSSLLCWQIHQQDRQQQTDEALHRLLLEKQAEQSRDQVAEENARRRAAEYAEHQFDLKFNDHAIAMNAIKDDREKGVQNLKHFEIAAHSWRRLYDDPNWLKRKWD